MRYLILLVGVCFWCMLVACQQQAEPDTGDAPVKDISTEEINYEAGGVKLNGFLAYDAAITSMRPGVLVVHEWWGHNDYVRRRAKMLAEMGYTAFAVDMYGDGKTAAHPDDAQKFMMELINNMEAATARFKAAEALLRAQPGTDPTKIAAIGYCFGGGVVLQMARAGLDLNGVASFHGGLATQAPAQPGVVKAKVLVLHGEDDAMTPAAQVEAFRKEMETAGVDMKFVSYPGAKHSFTNPDATEAGLKFSMPLAYNEEADKKSWAELDAFLREVFK